MVNIENMEEIDKNYKHFIFALKEAETRLGVGKIATQYQCTPQYIYQIINGSKIAGRRTQFKIAAACGYDYLDFLQHGKQLYEGELSDKEKPDATPPAPIPMDPAIEILHEALEETGVTINERQKHAVLKILREELAKLNSKTKEDIKKYLAVFGK